MFEIINTFTSKMDSALALLTNLTALQLAGQVAPFLALLIAVTLAFFVLKMAVTNVFDTMGFVYFVTRSALIYSVVTGGLVWSSYVYPFLAKFGENIGILIVTRFAGAGAYDETTGFATILEKYYDQVVKVTNTLKGEVISGAALSGPELEAVISGFFVILVTMLVVGVAFALLTLAKMFLALFLALAPLFLVWAYLGATKSIVDGYIQGLVRLIIVQILVFAILGLFTAVSGDVLAKAKLSADAASAADKAFLLSSLWHLVLVSVIGAIMLFAVPSISGGLAGGAISVGATTAAFTSGAVLNAAKLGGSKSAAAAGKGAAKTASYVASRVQDKVGKAASARERAQKIVRQLK
jgi:type IV secretory pathway VirB6-like protein